MRLALSSAAAPDAMLEELLEAATRRGLEAVELREGDAHGVARATRRSGATGWDDEAAGAAGAGSRIRRPFSAPPP